MRRPAIIIHFSQSEQELLLEYFLYTKSQSATGKLAQFILFRKHDPYRISRFAVISWLKKYYPEAYASTKYESKPKKKPSTFDKKKQWDEELSKWGVT